MKIPDNFKKKYNLTGTTYDPRNVEAALSELFSVSSRLYKENADLRAELASLREQTANTEPMPARSSELSMIENRLAELSAKLGAIHTSVNDTLCVANDAVISAKKAETAAADALEALGVLEGKLDRVELAPVIVHENAAAAVSLPEGEEYDGLIRNIPEEIAFAEEHVITLEQEGASEEQAAPEQETTVEIVSDVVIEPMIAEEEVSVEAEAAAETPEAAEAADPTDQAQKSIVVPDATADELIRSAGLFDEPEQIEPAAEVADEDVTAKLNDMIANQPAEEPLAEEAPTQANYTDMKSALDAIRARLKK